MSLISDHPQWNNNKATISEMAKLFIKLGIKITTAESCTGGLIASSITNEDGSSKIFQYGAVTYAPIVKQNEISVAPELTTDQRIVSKDTAESMNLGLQKHIKENGYDICDVNISITGWIGSSPVKEENKVFFTLGNQKKMKTFKVFVDEGANKKVKKVLLVRRIFLEIMDFMGIAR